MSPACTYFFLPLQQTVCVVGEDACFSTKESQYVKRQLLWNASDQQTLWDPGPKRWAARSRLICSDLMFRGVFSLCKWNLMMMVLARNSPFLSVTLITEFCVLINFSSPSWTFVELSAVLLALGK